MFKSLQAADLTVKPSKVQFGRVPGSQILGTLTDRRWHADR